MAVAAATPDPRIRGALAEARDLLVEMRDEVTELLDRGEVSDQDWVDRRDRIAAWLREQGVHGA